MKRLILPLGLALVSAGTVRAGFSPVPIDPSSFNHDVVIEATSPISLNGAVNATMDAGTNKAGDTWYERGYNQNAPTTGIPTAGSLVTATVSGANYAFRMPPDYHVNNVIMVGHNNGGRTPLLNPGAFNVTGPSAFTGLSFLTSAGNGPVSVGYTLMHDDGSVESGVFSSPDWFNNTNYIFNAAGRVNIGGGGIDSLNGNPAGAVYGVNVTVQFPAGNITNITLFYAGSGGTTNAYNNGRAVIFAVSGAKDSSTDYTNTLAVTGYDYDAVVEADGPPTTGVATGSGTNLLNHITATMDGGTSKANNCWFEKGWYTSVPGSGIPNAGSTFTSANLPATYTMPSSYGTNCAVLLASNVTSAGILLSSPAAYGALSFLGASANGGNGDTFIPCVIEFQDGSTETNAIFIPEWVNRNVPWAYLSFGRVNPNNNTLNSTPERFVDPFAVGLPGFDYRGLGLPNCRLFDCVINVNNTSGIITNIALNYTNGSSARVAAIFAVSGASGASIPPVFGVQGTPTPGQPLNASVNAINLVKAWEGTNNIILSVTNITGSGISYQWKKAPRGGGVHDLMYSIDYNTFANVANGGRYSGAASSALVISNALIADSADYLVVASNGGGAITSLVATVQLLTTNGSLLVGAPAGDVITPIAADASPTAESIDHVIDQVAQKWLSDGLQSATCCGGPLPFTGPVGYVVTPVSGASVVTSMRFFAANDSNGRDPWDYTLEGSNDGVTFTRITGGALKGTLTLPTGRNGTGSAALDPLGGSVTEVDFANATGYKSFRVSITNNINRFGDQLMQVAEIQLLGTLVPNPPVFARQPESVTVFAGTSPQFAVEVAGYPPPRFQWYKGATLVPGATASIFTFTNAQIADSSTQVSCRASNTFGTVPSSSATLTVIAAPTQSYPMAVLADRPLGYWRLDEGPDDGFGNNGVITHDYAGGHNGFYSNTVIAVSGYNPNSDLNTAAQFGSLVNSNSYVADILDLGFARASNAVGGGTFSVEAWVYGSDQLLDAAIVSKGYNGILAAGTGTGAEQFVLDLIGADPRKFRFLVRDSAGNGYVALSSVVPFTGSLLTPAPAWHHLLGVCDQPNGKLALYIDGLLAATGTIPSNAGILNQPLPMTIGARQSGGATEFDNQWIGKVDDVAVYGTALSSTQALAHYFAGQLPPVITLQPTNATVAENVAVTFYSEAYGSGTLGYQWYISNGTDPTSPVPGQTSSNLTFTTFASQSGNNYQLIVTNAYGAVTSVVAQLTVVSGPPSFIVDLPTSQTFYIGHIMQLSVVAGGTAPFTYRWQKNGVDISDDYRTSGSTSNVLTMFYANTNDSGGYQVLVSNGSGGPTPSTLDAVTVTNAQSGVPFTPAGTGWQMQGSTPPIMGNGTLELTSNLGGTARSAFMSGKVVITSFNASFVYQDVTGAGGADGVTFCIQNDTRGAGALGGGGGSLGYSGINPSIALALNIYDPNTRGVRFIENGVIPGPGAGSYVPATPVLIGGNTDPVQITLAYLNGVLSANFRDTVSAATFATNMPVDIASLVGGSSAYVGFTGADGGVASTQVISNFTMVAAAPPVNLQATHSGNSLILSWPVNTGAFLQSTPSLNPEAWTGVTAPVTVVGNQIEVTITPLTGTQFYRLQVFP